MRGRAFGPRDRAQAPQVVMINETAARKIFPGEEPLGRRIELGMKSGGVPQGGEIVGVVADVKQDALEAKIDPQLFLPYDQLPMESVAFVVRSTADPRTVAAAVQGTVRAVDPDLPVYGLQPMAELVAASTSPVPLLHAPAGGFAAIALVLAAVGIYGVTAYAVRQRTQEIGIRMALGASRDRVLRMVVGQGMALALAGAAAGLAGALLATRGLHSLLYEVSTSDPPTFVAVPAVLLAVAALASYLPRPPRRCDRASAGSSRARA